MLLFKKQAFNVLILLLFWKEDIMRRRSIILKIWFHRIIWSEMMDYLYRLRVTIACNTDNNYLLSDITSKYGKWGSHIEQLEMHLVFYNYLLLLTVNNDQVYQSVLDLCVRFICMFVSILSQLCLMPVLYIYTVLSAGSQLLSHWSVTYIVCLGNSTNIMKL